MKIYNEVPFTAWKHTERNRHRDKKVFTITQCSFGLKFDEDLF